MNRPTRTVVLGFDGIDAKLVTALAAAGELPHLKSLADNGGTFRRVLSTTPAESAVAWTSFNMGANPAETNMFDFVGRLQGTYSPHLAGTTSSIGPAGMPRAARWGASAAGAGVATATAYAAARRVSRRGWVKGAAAVTAAAVGAAAIGVPLMRWAPDSAERITSVIRGQPWWDRIAAAGGRSVVLRMPLTFPARAAAGVELLSGLGVPDVRGTTGSYLLLTDRPGGRGGRGTVLPLHWDGDECSVSIPGPDTPVRPGDAGGRRQSSAATVRVRRAADGSITLKSGVHSETVRKGEWSGWLPLEFGMTPLSKVRGITRFHCAADDLAVTLYATPIAFDPADPPTDNPVSSPPAFAKRLSDRSGRFRTVGWETQTSALVDGAISDAAYLADVKDVIRANLAQFDAQLKRDDWDNLMLVVQATDQLQHVFFDDQIVAVRDGTAGPDHSHPLVNVYRQADEIVGRVAAEARARGWRLVVMSDHGFAPYRREVNLNTWLAKRGWLALKDKKKWDTSDANRVLSGEVWSNVDWFNTRAYALGLGGVFLNVAGREPSGIVKRGEEYEFLQEKLADALLGWRDSLGDRPLFANVYRRQDIYKGPHLDAAPDLVLGFREGYRVSSASAVGGIPEHEVADNRSRWAGDHCGVDAPQIPGICFTNFQHNWSDPVPIQSLAALIWPPPSS